MNEDDVVVSICQTSAEISAIDRRERRFRKRRFRQSRVEQATIYEKCKLLSQEILEQKKK